MIRRWVTFLAVPLIAAGCTDKIPVSVMGDSRFFGAEVLVDGKPIGRFAPAPPDVRMTDVAGVLQVQVAPGQHDIVFRRADGVIVTDRFECLVGHDCYIYVTCRDGRCAVEAEHEAKARELQAAGVRERSTPPAPSP